MYWEVFFNILKSIEWRPTEQYPVKNILLKVSYETTSIKCWCFHQQKNKKKKKLISSCLFCPSWVWFFLHRVNMEHIPTKDIRIKDSLSVKCNKATYIYVKFQLSWCFFKNVYVNENWKEPFQLPFISSLHHIKPRQRIHFCILYLSGWQ